MNLILCLYDRLCWSMCRHVWVRERENGQLWERCTRCMKRQPDRMTALVKWNIDYEPIEPAHVTDLPKPLHRKHMKKAA